MTYQDVPYVLTTSSPIELTEPAAEQTTLPPVHLPTEKIVQDAPLSGQSTTTQQRNGVFTCNQSSSGVTTNFVNLDYRNRSTGTGDCWFKLVLQPDVCQVRVDFVDTELLQPEEGQCKDQSLKL